MPTGSLDQQFVGGYVSHFHPSVNRWDGSLKYRAEQVVAFLGLLALAPFLVAILIMIKLDSPGPSFFMQQRVGLNGKRFWIYKFRTMHVGAEARQAELMAQNEMVGPVFKLKNDPRITRVGHWIRKTSLDELPQLLNIVRGEMSFVGPRPLPVYEVEKLEPWQLARHSVRPGLSGLWQISGRSEIVNFDRMIALDIQYIEKWSLELDLAIVLKTIPVVLKCKGAH